MRDDAGKRRGDPRVGEQRLRLVLVGPRDGELLLRGGDRGLRRGHLRLRDAIAALGLVDVLLRDQVRPLLHHGGQARRSEMRDLVRRLGAREIGLRAVHFFLAALDARFGGHHVVLQLGNLQHRQQLARR